MQKFKVTLEWMSGFKSTHHIHGRAISLKERKFLDELKHLSKYTIKEVNFKGW